MAAQRMRVSVAALPCQMLLAQTMQPAVSLAATVYDANASRRTLGRCQFKSAVAVNTVVVRPTQRGIAATDTLLATIDAAQGESGRCSGETLRSCCCLTCGTTVSTPVTGTGRVLKPVAAVSTNAIAHPVIIAKESDKYGVSAVAGAIYFLNGN